MAERTCLVVLLAAGEGTRMRSAKPKVLHAVGGRAMVCHAAEATLRAGATRLAVVIGPNATDVAKAVRAVAPDAETFEQHERLGTAHAVLQARAAIAQGADDVMVVFGDTPLLRPETLSRVRIRLADNADVVVLGFETDEPAGYGRLLVKDGQLIAIREERDATDEERQVKFCNAGIMAFRGEHVLDLLDAIGNANAKGEYYLTDAVEVARAGAYSCRRGGRGERILGREYPCTARPVRGGIPRPYAACGPSRRRHAGRAGDGHLRSRHRAGRRRDR